jgi:hypothetical protein
LVLGPMQVSQCAAWHFRQVYTFEDIKL